MSRILTPRLELVAATLKIVSADLHCREELPNLLNAEISDQWPPPLLDVAAMLSVKEALTTNGDPQGWTTHYVIEKDARMLIGICGFKTAPQNGSVEFGYTIVPQYQRRGLGTEIVAALTAWAFEHDDVECVFAETLPDLIASQRVLHKNGFTRAQIASAADVIRFERRRNSQRD
jgi:[ribosomal protein S5]-alanine N-acetyltransferase